MLSNTELYYALPENISGENILLIDSEATHIISVMRHKIGDIVNITNGKGTLFSAKIAQIGKKSVSFRIEEKREVIPEFPNITVCSARVKANDRFEFMLEKCVELGITKFIIFDSERSVAKGDKSERWRKILLAAMKQSLRCTLPEIEFAKNTKELARCKGQFYLFEQNSSEKFSEYLEHNSFASGEEHHFVFGPEGGLSDEELSLFENAKIFRLTENRLRSETAVVAAVSLLTAKS